MSVVRIGRVDQTEADLIQDELVPQFLGLWVKLNKNGISAHTGQRGLALSLLQSSNHIAETKNWHSDPVLKNMEDEVAKIVDKFLKNGLHFALISTGLVRIVCQLLGTVYDPNLEEAYNDSQ